MNNAIAASKTNARLLAGRIKKSTAYTNVIGKQLNIIGAEDSTDMTQEQPTLFANVKAGGVVEIDFNKMDAEGVHIYGMRDGETGFSYLASETHPPTWTTAPCWRRANPKRANTKPCSSSAKARSACPAPSSSPSPRRD